MSERFRVRKFVRTLTGAATLVVLASLTLVAGGSAADVEGVGTVAPAGLHDGSSPVAESFGAWFVELANAPAVKGTGQGKLTAEHQAFRKAAADAGIAYSERYAFSTLWNGLSVDAGPSQAAALARLPGVAAVYPVLPVSIPPGSSISPELATAISMTGADIAQEAGWTGEGVKVAIMDTGVDYDHADLGGDGVNRLDSKIFPTSRVVAGWDFVGDKFRADFSSPAYDPKPHPDPYPDDCNGHGTHVAGIVGANAAAEGGATGVAPDVTFGAYRVFGCDGSTTADIMIAAMERALADDMDVLNMSIGSAFNNWNDYPTASASNNLVDAGMVVVASIGNSGANGMWAAGAPGVGEKVIGVASFDNTHISALTFRTNPEDTQIAYLQIANTTEAPTSGDTPEVVYVGRGCPQAGPSWSLPEADPYLGDPSGKIALIDRGICTFEGKYQRAIDAGAVGVVVANNLAGLFAGGGIVDRGFPAVGISLADGNALKAELEDGPVTLTWTSDRVNAPNPTGGLISSFSSYGTAAELDLKPDIGGPGGLIRSTYPLQSGGYAIVSGTSMSSPHVAGTVALLLQAKGPLTPAQVRDRLQNTAEPKNWQGNPGLGFLDQIQRQGAGMVRIDRAIDAAVSVSPGKLSLGEAGPAVTTTLTLTNSGDTAVTYTPSHVAALSTFGNTNAPGATTSGAAAGGAITFAPASVTVPAHGSAIVDVTIPRPNFGAASKVVFGGWIRFTPEGGGISLRVPYVGFGGDYQGFPVMNGLPNWNEIQSVAISGTPTGGSFTLTFTPPSGGAAETTGPIAFNATATAVRLALEALPSIAVGDVATAGGALPGTAVSVTFQGALGAQDIAQMTATSALTGGTSPAVTVSTTRQGQPAFPKLAKRVGWSSPDSFVATYSFPSDAVVYTMHKTNQFGRLFCDCPTVAVHLEHQVRSLRISLLNADGSPVTFVGEPLTLDPTMSFDEFLPRNSTSLSFFAFEWDGRLSATTKQGKATQKVVPKGDYRLKVDILKAGGTAGTEGHTESYTSPVFTIKHGA